LATAGTAGSFAGTESTFVRPCQHEESHADDTCIRSAKPAERDYKLTDFDGLYLLVCKNGSKLWRFLTERGVRTEARSSPCGRTEKGSQLDLEACPWEAGVRVFVLAKKGFGVSVLATVTILTSPALADMSEVTSLLLKVCLAGGTSSQVEGQAKGDVALTLNALKSGKIGTDASLGGKYSKTDWEGLQGGISAGITALQADQADKARACLAPYMPGIVQAILQSK